MSAKYVSISTHGINTLLIEFLKENFKANIKVINSELIYVESNESISSWLMGTNNSTDAGFKILDYKILKGEETDLIDQGFEMINKEEAEDLIVVTKKGEVKIIEDISKALVNTVVPAKAGLRSKDAFEFITSKEYLLHFTFVALVVISLIKLIESN
jgi:hypothetical protein